MRLVIVVFHEGFPVWEAQFPVHPNAYPSTLVEITKAIPKYQIVVLVDPSDPVHVDKDEDQIT